MPAESRSREETSHFARPGVTSTNSTSSRNNLQTPRRISHIEDDVRRNGPLGGGVGGGWSEELNVINRIPV